jgi:hypothetical protein
LEALEDRTLPSTYYTATTSELIADINAANRAGGANTITLTAPTTSPYVLTAVNNTTNGANGLPVISGGSTKVAADNLTIVGNGDTIDRVAGSPAFRLFDAASGSSLTLENLTLQGGLAFGSSTAADGGAIYNQGTLTLSGVTVQGNTAQGSNGADGSTVTVTIKKKNDTKVVAAQPGADAAGGGIWSSGSVTLQGGSIVQNNQAIGGKGGNQGGGSNPGAGGNGLGGGIWSSGSLTVENQSVMQGNSALGGAGGYSTAVNGPGGKAFGGAIYIAGGTATIKDSQIGIYYPVAGYGIGNFAQGGRGGNTQSSEGGAAFGGGVYVAGGTVTMNADSLQANSAQGDPYFLDAAGGGLYVAGGSVTLTNDSVQYNVAGAALYVGTGYVYEGQGGGMYIASAVGATAYLDSFTLANTYLNHPEDIVGSWLPLGF